MRSSEKFWRIKKLPHLILLVSGPVLQKFRSRNVWTEPFHALFVGVFLFVFTDLAAASRSSTSRGCSSLFRRTSGSPRRAPFQQLQPPFLCTNDHLAIIFEAHRSTCFQGIDVILVDGSTATKRGFVKLRKMRANAFSCTFCMRFCNC